MKDAPGCGDLFFDLCLFVLAYQVAYALWPLWSAS